MCRVYGVRVRVCKARGGPVMIPAADAQWNRHHDHVLGRTGQRCRIPSHSGDKCPQCGNAMILCRGRCLPVGLAGRLAVPCRIRPATIRPEFIIDDEGDST